MNYNRLRPYASITMVIIWILLIITGGLLYLAPHGSGSKAWSLMGLSKHDYKDIHLCLGIVVALLVTIHGCLNMKPLKVYIQNPKNSWLHPVLFATTVVVLTVIIALSL